MIFTNCTNTTCQEPIMIAWESGDEPGYYRYQCGCGQVSFIELTSLCGNTLSEEEFWQLYPYAINPTDN